MTCTHLVYGYRPCTRPAGHFPNTPHLAGFMTPDRTFAAVCGVTFGSNRAAINYLLRKAQS